MSKFTLFGDLPPPVAKKATPETAPIKELVKANTAAPVSSILSSKRAGADNASEGGKRVRFKPTTTEASSEQVLDAMTKIASHIGNSAKFSKASKLALQLLQSGSVTLSTAEPFFQILKAAMATPSHAIQASLRLDYQALFTAVHERLECFTGAQQAQIEIWEIWALVGNDFMTDDTYVFSKASSRIKQNIDALPEATEEDNVFEERQGGGATDVGEAPVVSEKAEAKFEEESDPFGLNAFLPKLSKKEERLKRKLEEEAASKRAQEEAGRQLKERREALLECLRLAAEHYKMQWAQTIIDILVRHAFDNLHKFTSIQKIVIEKLWASVREQQTRRKQGKFTTGKLDVTSFERLQDQYSREHISIRRAVGHGGGRSAEQWLG